MILLETYTSQDEDVLDKNLPQFLKIVKNVTGNPDYSMFNLSLREEWHTTKKFCRTLQQTGKSKLLLFYSLEVDN